MCILTGSNAHLVIKGEKPWPKKADSEGWNFLSVDKIDAALILRLFPAKTERWKTS